MGYLTYQEHKTPLAALFAFNVLVTVQMENC